MIFVTGGTGLLGAHLLYDLCTNGKKVVALKRETSNLKNVEEIFSFYSANYKELLSNIIWRNGDVEDVFSLQDAMTDCTEVYHCAGLVSFDKKDIDKLLAINSNGTANMINVALDLGIKKFCHVSSVAALSNHDHKGEFTEKVFWKSSPNNSYYAISKYNGEREAWRGSEEGLNVVIVNPTVILGPGCWGQSSSQLLTECAKGIKVYTEGIVGYVDVRDVSKSMISLMEGNYFAEKFIINSENKNYKEVFDLFHKEFGKAPAKYKVGKTILKIGRFGDFIISKLTGSKRRITKDTAISALEKNYFSNKKIIEAIGIQFKSIPDSIQFACSLYKKTINS